MNILDLKRRSRGWMAMASIDPASMTPEQYFLQMRQQQQQQLDQQLQAMLQQQQQDALLMQQQQASLIPKTPQQVLDEATAAVATAEANGDYANLGTLLAAKAKAQSQYSMWGLGPGSAQAIAKQAQADAAAAYVAPPPGQTGTIFNNQFTRPDGSVITIKSDTNSPVSVSSDGKTFTQVAKDGTTAVTYDWNGNEISRGAAKAASTAAFSNQITRPDGTTITIPSDANSSFVYSKDTKTFSQVAKDGKTVVTYDWNGNEVGRGLPTTGGGGLLGAISGALGTDGSNTGILNGASELVSGAGKYVADNPALAAVITAIAAAEGIPPEVTAAALGLNRTSQDGNIAAGLTTGLLSYAGGTGVNSALAPATDVATTAATTAAADTVATTAAATGGNTDLAALLSNAGYGSSTAASATGLAGTLGMDAGLAATAVNGGATNALIGAAKTGNTNNLLRDALVGAVSAGGSTLAGSTLKDALAPYVADGSINSTLANALANVGSKTVVNTVSNGGNLTKALTAAITSEAGSQINTLATNYVKDSLSGLVSDGTISPDVDNALVAAASGGVKAGVAGKDILTGALAAGAGNYVGSQTSNLLSDTGLSNNIINALSSGTASAASTGIQGRNGWDAFISSGLGNYAKSTIADWTGDASFGDLAKGLTQTALGYADSAGNKIPTNTRVTYSGGVMNYDPSYQPNVIDVTGGTSGGFTGINGSSNGTNSATGPSSPVDITQGGSLDYIDGGMNSASFLNSFLDATGQGTNGAAVAAAKAKAKTPTNGSIKNAMDTIVGGKYNPDKLGVFNGFNQDTAQADNSHGWFS